MGIRARLDGVGAGLDLQHLDVLGPQREEQVGVAVARLGRLRGRGQHHDAGVGAAGGLQEVVEDDALARLVLGAADGDQQTGLGGVRGGQDLHGQSSSAKRIPAGRLQLHMLLARAVRGPESLPSLSRMPSIMANIALSPFVLAWAH